MSHNTKRWTATINYRTKNGIVDVEHEISEIAELHDIVERGPHWDTIENIDVRLRYGPRTMTVEEAKLL